MNRIPTEVIETATLTLIQVQVLANRISNVTEALYLENNERELVFSR